MIKIYLLVVLLAFLSQGCVLKRELRINSGDTFVTELIVPFDMPVDDFQVATKNQLSRNDFKTSELHGKNVTLSKLVYKTTYNGSNKTVTPSHQSSKHEVINDSIDLIVTYQAAMSLSTKHFNGTTTLTIFLNYTKQIDTSSGTTQFQNLVTFVDPSTFKMNFTGSPNANQTKILNYANNGNASGGSIWFMLKEEEFSSKLVEQYFEENLIQQRISPTYNSTYSYDFDGSNTTFDMRTAKIQDIDKGIAHSMRGSIKNFNEIQIINQERRRIVEVNEDYHTLFSVEFVKNYLKYCVQQNQKWKNYSFERSRYTRSTFGFRLVDLQFVVDGVEKYRQYYLNQIKIICNPKAFGIFGIDEVSDKLDAQLTWSCKGLLQGINPNPVIFDFDANITYLINFNISNDMLVVKIQKNFIQKFQFRQIPDIKVTDFKIFKIYARQLMNNIFGYTVGTNFKVKTGSSRVNLKQNEGIWVG